MADALAALQISDGASHQYNLDETTGSTAIDRGSVPINGTYTNNGGSGHFVLNQAPITPGATGCVYLDGAAYIDFNFDVTANLAQAWSLEIVHLPTNAANVHRLIANDAPWSTGNGFNVYGGYNTDSVSPGSAAFVTSGQVVVSGGNKSNELYNSQRYLVHFIWRGAGGNLEFWVNGVLLYSAATAGNYKPGGYHISVGRDPQYNGDYLIGYVADFAHYNFALSTTQIANHVAVLGATLASPVGIAPAATAKAALKAPSTKLSAAAYVVNPSAAAMNVSLANVSGLGQIFPTGRS